MRVAMFTDGACRGNPGPGGWGVVMRYKGDERRAIADYRQVLKLDPSNDVIREALKRLGDEP